MAYRKPRNVRWTVEVDELTSPALVILAIRLGFFKEDPGESERMPSPSAMLDALAEAIYHDPASVEYLFKSIGVNPEGVATASFAQEEDNLPEDNPSSMLDKGGRQESQ